MTAASGLAAVHRSNPAGSPSTKATWPARPFVSTLARSVAVVFVTAVLLGAGYVMTAGAAAGSVGSAGGGVVVHVKYTPSSARAAPESAALASRAASAVGANLMARFIEARFTVSERRAAAKDTYPPPSWLSSWPFASYVLHTCFPNALRG